MKIGMVLYSKFPPDIRIEKEARTLLNAGHKVYLLSYTQENEQKSEELVNGIHVRRIPPPWVKLSPISRMLNSLKFYLIFYNSYWAKQIERFVSDFEIQSLHVHDLPLLGTAISAGNRSGVPVIADLHENYPAALQILHKNNLAVKTWFTKNPTRWLFYERNSLLGVKHIIVVVEEAKQRLIEQHCIPADKLTVLMNVEDIEYFSSIELDTEILTRYRNKFLISYIGGGGIHRGLDTTIRSIAYLQDEGRKIHLLLVGPEEKERQRLCELAKVERVGDQVEIIKWQPFNKVPSYIKASDICLVPHQKNSHTDTTIPHKLFQYMLMKKPVIVSNCRPLKRIVEETGCGLVFQSGNPQDLAKSINTLYKDRKQRQERSRLGQQSVLNRYNWFLEGEKLCSLYESFEQESNIH